MLKDYIYIVNEDIDSLCKENQRRNGLTVNGKPLKLKIKEKQIGAQAGIDWCRMVNEPIKKE